MYIAPVGLSRVARRLGFVSVLALLFTTSPAIAQDRATVVMRSGNERITGQFEDLNNGTIYIRESLHSQRRLPLSGILVIDFAGNGQNFPAAEEREARGADHLLVVRGGSSSRGRLVNIEGGDGSSKPGEPRIVSFRTVDGEERRMRPSDIARIYLGGYPRNERPEPAAPEPDAPAQPGDGIAVQANQAWTRTGIVVSEGQMVSFTATGQVRLSSDPNDVATPDGARSGRQAPDAPMRGILAGALIGRVGRETFGIGGQTQALRMPADGELLLGVNDDAVSDNRGQFNVGVSVNRPSPSRRPRR
ncbi:MAG: hypothetical protein JNM38_18510 [Acidobacteria bacterium]|nr:hypothetical protein [Acidobacteriota bacterium]